MKEAGLMQTLRPHQNVVHLFGVCIHDEKYYIVMEFLKGGDLLTMLRRAAKRKSLNEAQRVHLALSIASGMLHLHAENILHRDLAARNVLLSRDGEPRISDFGMSHHAAADSEQQIAAEVGPIRWMAPESLAKGVYSAKTDVFSFGILLYELLSDGKIPQEEIPLKELAERRRDECLVPEAPPKSSPVLASLLKQCCSKKPGDRPTFKAIVKQLSEFLQQHYPDEDSDGPASPRERAMTIQEAMVPDVAGDEPDSTTPGELATTTTPASSGTMPPQVSGSRDDLSNAILPKSQVVKKTAQKKSSSTSSSESEDEAADEEQAEEEESHGSDADDVQEQSDDEEDSS